MTKGLKVWLWIILVINIFAACLIAVGSILVNPTLVITLGLEIVLIIGIILLLFKQKKLGLYIFVACASIGLIINIVSGKNIVTSLFFALFAPSITYLLMKDSWNEFH